MRLPGGRLTLPPAADTLAAVSNDNLSPPKEESTRLKSLAVALVVFLLVRAMADASVLRVVVVQPTDVDGYVIEARFALDPELKSWLQSLDKLRKVISDSLYNELTP